MRLGRDNLQDLLFVLPPTLLMVANSPHAVSIWSAHLTSCAHNLSRLRATRADRQPGFRPREQTISRLLRQVCGGAVNAPLPTCLPRKH